MTPFKKIFQNFSMLLIFLGAVVVVNIWSFAQKADQQKAVTAQKPAVTTAVSEETTSQPLLSAGTGAVTGAAPVLTTAPPALTFQTVDLSYFDDALFIGDSRTEGLALYGDLTNADYFCNIGLSIYEVENVVAGNPNEGEQCTLAQKLGQKKYGKVYVMLGLNELGTGTTEEWAQKYKEVLDQIHQAQPDAIIYIQSILVVSAAQDDPSGYINNNNVRTRNEALKALADQQTFFYLDVNEAVTDANGCLNADYTSDGIHLLGNSLSLWKNYLMQHAIVKGGAATFSTPVQTTTTAVGTGTPPDGGTIPPVTSAPLQTP